MLTQKDINAYNAQLKQAFCMPPRDREVLASKLKAELAEFKQRERMYMEKRRELQDLELMYRKKQDQLVTSEGKFKGKLGTNEMVIDSFNQQIEEASSILDN